MPASADRWRRTRDALIATDPTGALRRAPESALERRLTGITRRWDLSEPGYPVSDVLRRLDELAATTELRTIADLAPADRRHVVVAAHGPSLRPALDALRTHRDRIFLIAPFRTAIVLAASDIVADVAVLADHGHVPYSVTLASWNDASRDVRRQLTAGCRLLMEPLAPRSVYGDFETVAVFDPGLGAFPPDMQLPFWSYALVPAVSLAIAGGASEFALVGVDLSAAHGMSAKTWTGAAACLDRRMAPLLHVLQVLTRAGATAVDLGAAGIRKRGFELREPDVHLAGTPPRLRAAVAGPPGTADVAALTARLRARLEEAVPTIRHLRAHAQAAVSLAQQARAGAAIDTARLRALVLEGVHEWRDDYGIRTAVGLLQPTFLPAVWETYRQGVHTQAFVDGAAVRTALLVFGELLDATGDFERFMTSASLLPPCQSRTRQEPDTAATLRKSA